MVDLINTVAKYVIALVVVLGCFVLVYTTTGDQTQAWAMVALIVGWLIRDSAGNSATSNAAKIVTASQAPTNGG